MAGDWPLILAYHHVARRVRSRYAVTERSLERSLGRMLRAGYVPLSLEEAISRGPFGAADAPERSFTLTFDDGLASFRRDALPLLRRLELVRAAAVFVPTAFVGLANSWPAGSGVRDRVWPWADPEERLMTWGEIEEASRLGVSVQSHGHGHLAMRDLTYEEARSDAEASLAALDAHGIAARYLALPFGWRSETCKRAIRDAGFDAALSVAKGGADRFEIRRIPVYGTDVAPLSRLKLSGRYFEAYDAAARLAGRGG